MFKPIFNLDHLDLKFDDVELRRVYNLIKPKMKPFQGPLHTVSEYGTWTNYAGPELNKDPYVMKLIRQFRRLLKHKTLEAAMYWQKPNSLVHAHIDPKCPCAINYVLSGTDSVLYYLDYGEYKYKIALLDTSIMHGIRGGNEERILFKIPIWDRTYKQVREVFDAP